uniref:Phosphorylase b kinase regulatory subunit n=1 Tax=Macrostomum lignano TaxID=282301 RepID=A0A1I8HP25_9PLAT
GLLAKARATAANESALFSRGRCRLGSTASVHSRTFGSSESSPEDQCSVRTRSRRQPPSSAAASAAAAATASRRRKSLVLSNAVSEELGEDLDVTDAGFGLDSFAIHAAAAAAAAATSSFDEDRQHSVDHSSPLAMAYQRLNSVCEGSGLRRTASWRAVIEDCEELCEGKLDNSSCAKPATLEHVDSGENMKRVLRHGQDRDRGHLGVTVGLPPEPQHAVINSPLASGVLAARIRAACAGDLTLGVLTQELLVYLSMLARTEPQLFASTCRVRVGLIVRVMGSENGSSSGTQRRRSTEHLLGLSPFEMKTLLHHILSGKEFRAEYTQDEKVTLEISAPYRRRRRETRLNQTMSSDRRGQWLRRRKIDGALSRVPAGFYRQMWRLLERVDGLNIRGHIIGQHLTREMTAGEPKFALQVESIITSVPVPEYRQLVVEALSLLVRLPDMDPDGRLAGLQVGAAWVWEAGPATEDLGGWPSNWGSGRLQKASENPKPPIRRPGAACGAAGPLGEPNLEDLAWIGEPLRLRPAVGPMVAYLVADLLTVLKSLKNSAIFNRINVVWTPGHGDILGNELLIHLIQNIFQSPAYYKLNYFLKAAAFEYSLKKVQLLVDSPRVTQNLRSADDGKEVADLALRHGDVAHGDAPHSSFEHSSITGSLAEPEAVLRQQSIEAVGKKASFTNTPHESAAGADMKPKFTHSLAFEAGQSGAEVLNAFGQRLVLVAPVQPVDHMTHVQAEAVAELLPGGLGVLGGAADQGSAVVLELGAAGHGLSQTKQGGLAQRGAGGAVPAQALVAGSGRGRHQGGGSQEQRSGYGRHPWLKS